MARKPARKPAGRKAPAQKRARAPRFRWRLWLVWFVLFLAVLAALFFWLAPGMIERSMNRIEGSGLWRVEERTAALHDSLFVADLHADTLLWDRDLGRRADRGHVDLLRLAEGNVGLQVFGSVTKTPRGQNYEANSADTDNITPLVVAQLQPPRTWVSLLERSLYHAERLAKTARARPAQLMLIRSRADLEALIGRRADGERVIGGMMAAEGLQNIEGDIDNLDRLFDAGYRMAGLTHFFDNRLAGSMHGEEKGGLTPLGRQVVRRMEDRGMIVDLAHLSHDGVAEVLDMARRPVIVSHGGAQAICKVNRNLTDEEIRGVAATGGVIGVGFWDGAVCSPTPGATARTMRYIRDLVGIEHVALGSDFDGAVTTGFDAAGMAAVTQALLDQGFTEDEIRAAMGGNVRRVLMETLPAR
ncbi:dipeptidase [Pacificimonas flava]|uniref:Microsomal dipeptidase n=1 Tax=Pacificimonas flava TaxID=1234595 RepID=M2SEP9_9SPHN|nr:dipeptidase [Pacificimonas flava]EMD83815.1 Microsomal dipeptidase [Pacificimonas flava]MBB5280503.1 microsomal dipeptidase-like Zn-dependent dipeptidase [Pacificimonas flava]